jgi:hypothetical protein
MKMLVRIAHESHDLPGVGDAGDGMRSALVLVAPGTSMMANVPVAVRKKLCLRPSLSVKVPTICPASFMSWA